MMVKSTSVGVCPHTSMDNSVNIIEIHQSFQYRMSHHADDINVNRSNAFVDHIKGAFIHKLHADTDIRFGEERTKTRYDVLRVTVMHDL